MFGFIKSIRLRLLLFKQLYGGFKRQISVLVGLAVVGGFLGALGIAILVPLFSFIVAADSPSQDPVSRFIIGALRYFDIEPGLKNLLILITVLFVLKAVVLWFFGLIRTKIITAYSFNLRGRIYRETIGASWAYLLRHKIGFLENVIMADVNKVKNLLKGLINSVLHLASVAMYLIVAFGISVLITSITLGAGALILFFSKPLISKVRGYSKRTESIYKSVTHHINENIIGLKAIKAARVEKGSLKEGLGFFEQLRELAVQKYFVTSFISQPVEPLMIIFISLIFAAAYSWQPDFNIASFVVVVYLIQRIFAFVSDIQRGFAEFNKTIPHAERVLKFQKIITKNAEENLGEEPFRFEDHLVFKGVSFSYDSATRPVLEDVNFEVRKGEIFGIVGPSGVGKTTLVDLLLRLFKPERGEILIDGRNINTISLDWWRRAIGYVSQESFLKNDTISNNIRFFRENIAESDIVSAAKQADIYEFIQNLPNGFQAIAGERGVFLSGGQRQRIMLSRALAGSPSILILDEATSSLDHVSEGQIQETIGELKGKMTVIIIAHRPSTIQRADRIAVLRAGRIAEIGSQEDLRQNQNSYFNKMLSSNIESIKDNTNDTKLNTNVAKLP